MGLISASCTTCGASLKIEEGLKTFTCRYCGSPHGESLPAGDAESTASYLAAAKASCEKNEFGRAMQHVENGLALDPYHSGLLSIGAQAQQKLDEIQGLQNPNVIPDLDVASWSEAEQYKLKAEFILHALQANLQVYGSNSAFSGAQPADVDLALKYINRSLELYPDNPAYLNLKALFLIEGMVDRDGGLRLLERAAELAPRDITIQDNLEKSKTSSPCFIATAAYGSDFAWQVDSLRQWRDEVVLQRRWGPLFVRTYYRTSPLLAGTIRRSESLRALVRFLLRPLVHHIGPRTRGPRWNP